MTLVLAHVYSFNYNKYFLRDFLQPLVRQASLRYRRILYLVYAHDVQVRSKTKDLMIKKKCCKLVKSLYTNLIDASICYESQSRLSLWLSTAEEYNSQFPSH